MKKTPYLIGLLSLAALGSAIGIAHARTSTWTGAVVELASQNVCLFSNGSGGGLQFSTVAAAACAGGGYVDASITWDTAGNKTVSITGLQSAAGQITNCAVRTMDFAGTPVSTSTVAPFTAVGSYQTVSTPTFTVPAGGTSQVECKLTNSAARLLKIDNNPL